MIVCVPVQVIDAPGASSLTGIAGMQLNPSSAGESLTDTLCRVMLPSLVAVSVYLTTWPTFSYFAGLRSSVLVTPSFAFCSALIVSSAGGASASLLLAPAMSLKDPLSRSSWVIVCVPVHLIDFARRRVRDRDRRNAAEPFERRRVTHGHVVQRGVAFVRRRDRVFDDLTDFVVLRRVQVVRLGRPRASLFCSPLIVSSAGGASASLLLGVGDVC